MSQYLLSVHSTGDGPDEPPTAEEMQAFMQRVTALEAEMKATGRFVFGGSLHGPDSATVVRVEDGDPVVTDGPFADSKEHIGGFYIIEATDVDDALTWAGKVVEAIHAPIEVRPFRDVSP